MHVVHVAPSATIHGLQKSMLSHIGEDAVPIQGIFQVAHGAAGGAFRMLLVRQDDGGRHGYAQLGGQRVVEKLVVCRPPERIVDNERAVESGMLEKGTIEGDVVGDAVHNHRVARELVKMHGAGFDKLGGHVRDVASIDVLHQGTGKAVLHAEQNADLLHAATSLE